MTETMPGKRGGRLHRGRPKGAKLRKINCPHCGEEVTAGVRMPKDHKDGTCKAKLSQVMPLASGPRPKAATYEGGDIPDLATLMGDDDVAPEADGEEGAPTEPGANVPGVAPPPDLSIMADLLDPQVIWPGVAQIPNAVITWAAPHSKTRIVIDKKKGEALHRFLPYLIPKLLADPFKLFALVCFFVFVIPIGVALGEEQAHKAREKKGSQAESELPPGDDEAPAPPLIVKDKEVATA